VRVSGSVLVRLLAELVSVRSRDSAGNGRQRRGGRCRAGCCIGRRRWVLGGPDAASGIAPAAMWNAQSAKPKQSANWGGGGGTCASRKSTSPCLLLAIPAFDRIVGLYNRHLNSNREICLR
jgi:hypothetical protein